MRLSDNFTLAELTKSQTAERCGIDNSPDKEHVDNLQKLCDEILQPIRDYFKIPVVISSGYRSTELSKKIGSSSRSQHCRGEAADLEIPGVSFWIHWSIGSWIVSEDSNLKYKFTDK